MKKFYFLLFTLFITTLSFGQIYTESFEGTNLYITSVAEVTDGSEDYFTTTDGSNIAGAMVYSGQDGTYFFAASDIDGNGLALPVTLTTNSIDVTGLSEIIFAVSLAEDDDGLNQDWDDGDYLHITYSIDGGVSQNLIWVEGDGSNLGSTFNHEPAIDSDFSGIGDGVKISSVFAEFSKFITLSSNSTITFTFEFNLDAGDEDIAIDNITVSDAATAGVVENQIEGFSLYPNPISNGKLFINSSANLNQQVDIYSMIGKQVYSKNVEANEIMDVSTLNSGIYMIRVEEDDKIATRKLIIR